MNWVRNTLFGEDWGGECEPIHVPSIMLLPHVLFSAGSQEKFFACVSCSDVVLLRLLVWSQQPPKKTHTGPPVWHFVIWTCCL